MQMWMWMRTLKLLLSSRRAAAGLPDVVAAETDNAGTEHGENARLRHFGWLLLCCFKKWLVCYCEFAIVARELVIQVVNWLCCCVVMMCKWSG